jgi:hypothetical protein
MEVISLVQDATHITVFSWRGLAFEDVVDVFPKVLAYVKVPDCVSKWVY